jgi:hypothetical protein
VRYARGSHGTDAVSAAGTAVSLADLFSIYNCPVTNITAANAIANIALANCGTSFILCFHALRLSASVLAARHCDFVVAGVREIARSPKMLSQYTRQGRP